MKNALRERYSRPPLHRMQRIHEWIKGGKFPNAVSMGKDLEVTDRTIKGDIQFMRNRHDAPIEYDEQKHGYYYTREYEFLSAAAMIGRHRLNGRVTMRGQPRLSWRSTEMYEPRPLILSDIQRVVAGADVFSRQSDGSTIAAQYAKHGITLRPATTDRVNGWAEVMQGFGDSNAGQRPTLFIHQRCKRLIETLPALQHDPNRPEDVLKVDADEDGNGGDDCADALRYLVATKGREIVVRKLTGW